MARELTVLPVRVVGVLAAAAALESMFGCVSGHDR